MTDITPSDTQHRAITAIRDWFQFGIKSQQVFRLFGFAGTGKSTVLKFALQELDLEPHRSGSEGVPCVPGVVTATFTGKAALVLRRKGTPGAFTNDPPDIMLTEIHRQAAESAIIRLATMARQGQAIGFGQYDAHVWKMRKMDVTPEQALRGGQVICGLNATRLQLNNGMRHAAGLSGSLLPSGPAEKIICLKNQNDLGLINGMFITLDDVVDENSLYFSAVVTDEDGNRVGPAQQDGSRGRLRIYKGHFEDHLAFDKHRHDRDWKSKRMLTEATFGWAITGHKSQGSQWENVVVWDDGLGRSEEDRRRWLYTVITRAEQGLVILA